jgi:hypothetical protein
MALHSDVWADLWERHWLGGAIAEWVDEAGLRQSKLVGFENVDSWADPLESVSGHQAQTAATGLKSFFVSKHDLGSLPAWFVLDNCRAAGAVAKQMDMACIRCGVHLIAIPLRHLFWPPHTRKAESATCTTQRAAACHSDGESSANWKALFTNTTKTDRIGTRLRSTRV